jgi:hypothetical protein
MFHKWKRYNIKNMEIHMIVLLVVSFGAVHCSMIYPAPTNSLYRSQYFVPRTYTSPMMTYGPSPYSYYSQSYSSPYSQPSFIKTPSYTSIPITQPITRPSPTIYQNSNILNTLNSPTTSFNTISEPESAS